MAATKDYIVKATGNRESRELHINKQDDGNYQIKLYWGRGNKDLATLSFTPQEWDKLASYSEGLKRK